VELITNDGAAAGAMLENSRLQGVIQGDGSDILRWNFIPNYESVEVGAIVYTSGTERMYPKGYPIGKVIQSTKGLSVYRDIRVKPFVDYLRLEEIMVVVSK
jgi:rod shape-determining protein MreC